MVADKSKLDKISSDSITCGIIDKLKSNLNASESSSSDVSLKSKSDIEVHTDQSINSSTKDESDDEPKNLNCTYSCPKPSTFDEDISDPKINEDVDTIDFFNSKNDNKSGLWKDLLNFTSEFDCNKWNSNLNDLKIANVTLKNSKMAYDNPDNSMLVKMRNYVAEFQEMRGSPHEDYNFSTLIKIMGHATGRCLFALSYVILNLVPILEIFLHILRFVLDKLIDLSNTTDIQQIIIKSVIFFVQLLSIYICLVFIFGFIVLPIVRMALGILAKIMLYD